jgi:FAD/FMN-containing dehydrogenase
LAADARPVISNAPAVHGNVTAHGEALLRDLRGVLGDDGVLSGEEALQRVTGWSRLGTPLALVRPRGTGEVSAIARFCHGARVPMVPWGGLTGLVSGAMADGAIAVSLERMAAIEEIDPIDGVMVVGAGCVLQTAQDAAQAAGMLLPLDLGARGSATIGGVIATNAGGNRVVRFGMMRDMVLGLEAVLANGTVVSAMKPLVKNNTGYDLKHMFIGAEGTLGIVTRAVLRLRPALVSRNSALLAVSDFGTVTRLLRLLESRLGGQLSAFEAMWPEFYELVTTAPARGRAILPHGHAFYVLVEAMGGDMESDGERFVAALGEAMEQGLVADAVIAQSLAEVEAMWAIRDDGEQVGRIGPGVALDVSLRLSCVAPFVEQLRLMLEQTWPGTRSVLFGHVGDGNIHVIVSTGDNTPARREAVTRMVLELAGSLGGSISAEHGIGLDKLGYLPMSRSAEEIATMRLIKSALDPDNLMNPGKTVPPQSDGQAAFRTVHPVLQEAG